MQVTKKNVTDTKVLLNVAADQEQIEAVKKDTLAHLASDVRLPGFRPGKAPLSMVEKSVNPSKLQTEFLDRIINALYGAAIDDQKLRPVTQPEVKISKFVPFETVEVEFEVEVVGEIKLADYKKIKFAKEAVKITDKDVSEVLEQLTKREAERKDVDRAAKDGDQVWIDFKGVDAKTKEPIKGADGKDYPLALGSGTFIPGFEPELIGLKKGDHKTFTVTFPKDYGVKTLQNRKVAFTVTVNKVQELSLPKLDDAFAAKVGPFKTVQELKDDIKKQLHTEKTHQADRDFSDKLLREITTKSKIALPDSLVEEQIDRIVNDQKQNLMYRGQTWQEFLEELGLTEEAFRKRERPEAEMRVKAGLVLGEIAEAEKIVITPEEVEIRIQLLKGQYPDKQMQAELNKPSARRDIASRLLSEKTIDKLVGYATATAK
jgi:trigger factor